jgi:glycosyltransferase involved in cell wall biosynthesis
MKGQTLPGDGRNGADRTVLLVTYYFPPAGGPGVQRMLKFAKYLPDFGWRPAVLTVREDAEYPVRDPSLAADVPVGTPIERTRITEFYRIYRGAARAATPLDGTPRSPHEGIVARALRAVRAGIFIPDGRVGWIPHALGPGARLARETGACVILSSGPPFTANLVGGLLHRRTGLPWVQDFRDPWTRAPFYPRRPGLARRLDEALEHWTLRRAARTLAVNRSMIDDFRARYPGIPKDRLITLPNGFDEADFAGIERSVPRKLTFVHTGTIHLARDPLSLRGALTELCREEEGFADGVEFALAGRIDAELIDRLRTPPLDRIIRLLGYVGHGESLRLLRGADYCLLFIGEEPEVRGMLTGKLFEYLGSGTPILAVAPQDGEAATVIRECRAGAVIEPADLTGMKEWLRGAWRRYRAGDRSVASPDGAKIAEFGRRRLTQRLASILEDVAAGVPPDAGSC